MDEPADLDVIIGTNLRLLRQRSVRTQRELGESVGVSYQQIQKYESGENRAAASHLILFARRLDVPLELFFRGIDDIEIAGDPKEVARIQRTAGKLARLPEPFRSSIEGLIDGFDRARPQLAAMAQREGTAA